MNGQITKKSMKFQWFLCRIDLTTNYNEEKAQTNDVIKLPDAAEE